MSEQKHWRHLFDEKYMGAWDLESNGKFNDKVVTIERFGKSDIVTESGKEKKVVVKFKEFPKEMVCNKTNFKRLQEMFGAFDQSAFIGKKVTLTTERVKNPKEKGTFVDALRFKKEAPVVKLPVLTTTHARYQAIHTAIQSGQFTVAQAKEHYELDPECEAALKAIIPSVADDK